MIRSIISKREADNYERMENTDKQLRRNTSLGEKLGRNAKENMVFLLDGDLGAGKTTLTQGIAKGLDIKKNVTSPTFTIQKIYHGRMPLYHIDAYRLEGVRSGSWL
jgi:tRNA threonylcarbamoyladenosine biosynthesis protein TsaE